MIKLPTTFVEANALAFAREYVARCREGNFLDLGYPLLHNEVSKAFAQRMIKMAMRDADIMLQIIDAAYLGWRDGRDALDSLIFDLTNAHQPLPSFLADYNARRLKGTLPPRLRGRQRSSNILQDIFIVTVIMELIERFDMQPTRRQTGRKREPSHCSIVSKAMAEAGLHRGGERAIEAVWSRYKASVLPGSRAEAVLASREGQNLETADSSTDYRIKEIPGKN
jgi:hypothetical protein